VNSVLAIPASCSLFGDIVMHFVWTILVGFVAGLVARALMPGRNPMGFFLTAVLGIAGSLIATYAGQALGWYEAGVGAGFIASIVGAVAILAIYHAVAGGRAVSHRP
jgi:uncharacterized membrane protein YeaQ/YmgE (transglycosylase-associated protein family)